MTENTSARLLAPADRLVTLPPGLPQHTLGYEAIRWATTYLRHPDGPRAGQRWEFVESQVRFVLWWYALDRQTGRWIYDHGVRRLAKGSGKALALDTPLPTPAGWTTMGEVRVGDELLDENGQPCTVLAATEAMHDRTCYRISFRDGTSIVADADHLWPVEEFVGGPKRVPRTVTTRELAERDIRFPRPRTTGKSKCAAVEGVARWKTLPTPALDLPEVRLPIPAYLLGYWLGDGDNDCSRVTIDTADLPEFAARMANLGVCLGTPKRTGNPAGRTFRIRFRLSPEWCSQLPELPSSAVTAKAAARWLGVNEKAVLDDIAAGTLRAVRSGFKSHFAVEPADLVDYARRRGVYGSAQRALAALGVLGNKHIPPVYMRASHKQRLELLRGIMDSDGCVSARGGGIELTFMSERLAADCVALMRSLGLYPRMNESDAVLNGRVVGRRWRIHVTAYAEEPIFHLSRKVERLVKRGPQIPYSQVRTITAVEPIPSVPVRCVSVSSPSSLYLAGEGLIPTHNSPIAAVLALVEFCAPVRLERFDDDAPGGCIGKPVPMPLVQIAATSENQTANTQRVIRAMTVKGSRLVRDHDIDPGKTVMYRPGGGQLEVITSSAAAAEGALPTYCVCDETEHWRPANGGVDLSQVLARNLSKTSSRAIETCNAWEPGAGSVAEETFDAWVAEQEGRTKGGARTLYDARIAPPDTDLADDESLRAGIAFAYGDCWWVDQETIRNSLLDPRTPVDVGRRFYLNQPVASQDAWSTPQEWAAIADPAQVMADVSDGDEIVAFFDGSRTRDATALMACHVESGDVFTIDVWEPPTGSSHSPGATYEVPADEVDAAVARMFDRWQVCAFFADVREWEGFVKVTWPERYADQLELHAVPGGKEPQAIAWDMRTRTFDFTMACELTLTEIQERAFRHDGDSRVGRHIVNARRHPNRRGVSIAKESRDSPKKIDAAVCVIGARMARRLLLAKRAAEPVKKPRSGRVHGFA